MSFIQESISAEIWDLKYRYRRHNKIIDKTIEDTWHRVARAVAHAEKKSLRAEWEEKFYHLLEGFTFLPGGRILAGAGTKLKVTLFNCFVMNIGEDSLDGIFSALKEGALTLQQGGGVGYDFSVLRPHGEMVEKTGLTSSGPVSFMRIWNTMCGVLLSTGARRGAMMGVLRCDHPDIEEFIAAKQDPAELRHFNVSVYVSDEFMQAVKEDKEWELIFPVTQKELADHVEIVQRPWNEDGSDVACRVYKRIKARELWETITRSAYNYAEPGVLFEDTINRLNNLWYREWISATNPCGEIPLPSYGACNLGSLNLTQFVRDAFTKTSSFDFAELEKCSAIATRFLDNVIDISRYPLKQQKAEALGTRRIGLGFTGLADAFVMLGLRYGSEESLSLATKIMKTISENTWRVSADLAKEKGSFPFYNAEKYLQGNFVKNLSQDMQTYIKQNGMRNSHHNTIAPTGTISLLANNISSGVEPIFSESYERFVLTPEGKRKSFTVTDYALQQWRATSPTEKLPAAWVDSQSLLPEDHLQIQRAVQPFIDNAISKTINLPENFPFENLHAVYSQAYEFGLKGCTIYRPNSTTGSVLSAVEPEEEVERCCTL